MSRPPEMVGFTPWQTVGAIGASCKVCGIVPQRKEESTSMAAMRHNTETGHEVRLSRVQQMTFAAKDVAPA